MAQRPGAIGLHLCEMAVLEAGTHNVTPVNCFSGRLVEQLPSDPISFVVFAVLTDGQGTLSAQLVIQRPDDLDEIYSDSVQVTLPDPLHEAWCRFQVAGCVFPIEGPYQVCLLIDGEPIAQRRLSILLREEPS